MEIKKTIGFVILLAVLLSSSVFAFGVSSPYWEGNPLIIEKGETKIINLNIQNMENRDIFVSATLTEGSDIASISNEVIEVKANTSDTILPLEITLPLETSPGESKKITVEFKTLDSKGGIAMSSGVSTSFNVFSEESVLERANTNIIIGIIIGIFLLSLILWLIIRRRRK